jgi:hypothetical protein
MQQSRCRSNFCVVCYGENMRFLSRGPGIAILLLIAVLAVLGAAGFFSHSATRSAPPVTRARGDAPSSNRATPPRLSPPVLGDRDDQRPRAMLEIEIDGAARLALTADEFGGRPTNLQAADRRAWRLTELIDGSQIRASTVIHAITMDGEDYILNNDGRRGADIIVVRRATGELYVGWLDGGADRPLADAERPAERIERVARIALATPAREPENRAATLAIVVDGKPRQTLTPESFAALARLAVRGPRDEAMAAIDVGGAFGAAAIVSVVAGGRRVAAAPPSRGARPVVYLTRRARFKLAWVDAAGAPIDGARHRDVSELALQTAQAVTAGR